MKNIKFIFIIILLFTININKVNAAKSIKDGTYVIKSALNETKVIDLYRGNTTNETNIQLYTNNNSDNQKWNITYENDGYYNISSALNENMAMDIYKGAFSNYSNIQLYKNNHSINQKWSINYIGNGYFKIISTNKNYCMDVNGGKTANETNIQLYKCNNSNAQKFRLVEVVEEEKTIEDGTYIITSALNDTKALYVHQGKTANGTNVEIYSLQNSSNQKWQIKYLNDGYYQITSKLSKSKCLDVNGAIFSPETNVQLYDCNTSLAQKWIIKDVGNGLYNIITAGNHMYMDIYRGLTTNGTNVQIYFGNDGIGQKFKFTKINDTILESGTYTIKTSLDKEKSLDVYGGKPEKNTEIKLYNSSNFNGQKFYITKLDNEYYTIKTALDSNLYLTIDTSSNLKLSETEKEWEISYIDEDQFYIIDKNTGYYLTIKDSNTSNGTAIELKSRNESNAQKFFIEETKINELDRSIADGYYLIKSSIDTKKGLDVYRGLKNNNTNVELYTLSNGNNQIWYFKYLNNGYYSITSAMNPNTSLNNTNNNVDLYQTNISANTQQWKLTDDTNGNKIIISKSNNTCIDLPYSKTDNETNIQTFSCNNQNNQKFKLVKYTETKTYTGIDVSQYQGTVDWAKVSNTNIGFVMLRLGYGDNWTSQDDKKFITNINELEKYNIPYGVYLYSYAKNITGSTALNANSESATSEAAHVIRVLNSITYKPNLKTAVYIDMEDESTVSLGKTKLTSIADKFCSTIESNGYNCGIYANTSWLTNNLDAKSLANKYNIWLAEWTKHEVAPSYTTAMTLIPSYNLTNYKLWQFSSKGSINGITGNVDVDLGFDIFD